MIWYLKYSLDQCYPPINPFAATPAGRKLSMTDPAAPQETEALIAHILERYHAVHRAELPDLVALARKVESVHAEDPDVPSGIAEALAYLQHAMEDHMAKEEMILFPAMRAGGGPGIESPIAAMRADHDDHAEEVALIRELTLDFTPPDHACGSWRRLYAGTAKLFDDLEAHIALENQVLFPRFEPAA
jgi:regulator of cell morphogenesis and NO signaling